MDVDISLDEGDVQLIQPESPNMSLNDDELVNNDYLSKKPMENLKISIENEEDPDPMVTFLKMETEDSSASEQTSEQFGGPVVNVNINTTKNKYKDMKKKIYENKMGSFETGINIASEDAKNKRQEHAKRFGFEPGDEVKEKNVDVDALYSSLGISGPDANSSGERRIRYDTIMLRGVNDLSTEDIFSYFNNYPPKTLEWIDDMSCNVVYSSINDANRSLINMSHPVKSSAAKQKTNAKSRLGKTKTTDNKEKTLLDVLDESRIIQTSSTEDMDDTIDLLTDVGGSGDNTSSNKQSSAVNSGAQQKALQMDLEEGEISDDENDDDSNVYLNEEEIPPGKWRVAVACSKTKSRLFMRLATNADVKVKGAERKSQYYKKYGNPNYGGMQGLISKSKKQQIRKNQEKVLEREAQEAVSSGGRAKVTYDADDLFGEMYDESGTESRSRSNRSDVQNKRKRAYDAVDGSEDISEELNELMEDAGILKKKRIPMMKMAADEEQEKLNVMRAHAASVLADIDVRKQIRRKQRDKILYAECDYPLEQEPSVRKPDLRSRLSRRNDW